MTTHQQHIKFIRDIADLLTIPPTIALRRFYSVLVNTKKDIPVYILAAAIEKSHQHHLHTHLMEFIIYNYWTV